MTFVPIGPLEIVILLAIVLLIFGASKLPQLGRTAGKGVNEVRGTVKDMVGDKADPETLGRKAGEGVREFRELKSAFKDEPEPTPKAESRAPLTRDEVPPSEPEAPVAPPSEPEPPAPEPKPEQRA